jgi:hypothetical protein
MEEWIKIILAGIGVITVIAVVGLLLAFPVKWCWNYTMPYLFELKTITWGQAWCLNFLAGCLVRSTQTNNNSK